MFTCDKTVVVFILYTWSFRAVTGGSACWGNGSVLHSLRLGNSALCICFHSQPDQTRPPGSIGLFRTSCANCYVVKQNSPSLTAASHSPLTQYAEPPVTTRQHSQLYDFRCKKFPEKSLLCRFLWEFLLFIILSATNLLQYVPVPVRLCFLHDRLPVNRILIYLLFYSLLTYSALIFLADEILPTVSY